MDKLTDEQQILNYIVDRWLDCQVNKEEFFRAVEKFKGENNLETQKEETKKETKEIRPTYYQKGGENGWEVFDIQRIIAEEAESAGLSAFNIHCLLTALKYLMRVDKGQPYTDITKAITYLKQIKEPDDCKGLGYIKIPEEMPIKKVEVTLSNELPSNYRDVIPKIVLECLVNHKSVTMYLEPKDITRYIYNITGYPYNKISCEILPALRALKMDGEPITITEHHLGAGEKRIEIRYAEQDPNYFAKESKEGLTPCESIEYQEKLEELEKLVLNYLRKFTSNNFYSTPEGIAHHISKQMGIDEKFLLDEILPIIYKLINKGENIKVTKTRINNTERTEIRYFTTCLGLGDK